MEDLEVETCNPISCEHIVLQGGNSVRSTKCMTEIVQMNLPKCKIVINWKYKSLEEFYQIPYIIFLLKLAYCSSCKVVKIIIIIIKLLLNPEYSILSLYSCNLKQEIPDDSLETRNPLFIVYCILLDTLRTFQYN